MICMSRLKGMMILACSVEIVEFDVYVFNSEMDSLILDLCREHGPSLNTYTLISQTLKCRSPEEVSLIFIRV